MKKLAKAVFMFVIQIEIKKTLNKTNHSFPVRITSFLSWKQKRVMQSRALAC